MIVDVVFDMIVPPDFEMMNFSGETPDDIQRKMFKDRDRVCGLDDAHARVAPFSPHLRLVLFKMNDLNKFYRLCKIAQCRYRVQSRGFNVVHVDRGDVARNGPEKCDR